MKWQPFMARLLLPLFVLASPMAGALAERLRPAILQASLCLLLVNHSRPFLFENWVRPLEGERSLLRTSRGDNYFADLGPWNNRDAYLRAVELTIRSGCEWIGIDISRNSLEYPYQALVRKHMPRARFLHTGVENASSGYRSRTQIEPCLILCLDCAGDDQMLARYAGFGERIQIGHFLIFRPL